MGSSIIFIIILLFSAIQSIIGVGLLVFGTPTLMLLGHSFQETLAIVLPPSLLISFIQTLEAPKLDEQNFKFNFNLFCLPFVVIGIALALYFNLSSQLKYLVGSMLIISGVIRFSSKLEILLQKFIIRYQKLYLVLMGSVHGLTNMGGGLLSVFASAINPNHKSKTRSTIAYGYLVMGSIQYTILLFYNPDLLNFETLFFVGIAGCTYYLLGRKLFEITGEKYFQGLVTFVILFYGTMLLTS